MQGLISKLMTLGRGNMHAAVDAALAANPGATLDQNVRSLSSAREELSASLSRARFDLSTLTSHRDADKVTEERLLDDMKMLKNANNGQPTAAQKTEGERLAGIILKMRAGYAAEDKAIQEAEATVAKMEEAVAAIREKETAAKGESNALHAKAVASKNLEAAASAIKAAGQASDALDNADSLKSTIERRNAVASDAFNNAVSDVGGATHGEVEKLKASELFASL